MIDNSRLFPQHIGLCCLMLMTLFFTACEGNFDEIILEQPLEIGVALEVNQGDKLIQDSADTVIRITHELDNDVKKIELLSGSAHLLRGSYELN